MNAISDLEKERKLIRSASLFLTILAVPYIFIFLALKLFLPSFVVFVCVCSYIYCFKYNQNYRTSGAVLVTVTSLALFFCSCVFGKDIGAHNFYFGFMSIALTLFISEKKRGYFIFVLVPIICMLVLEVVGFDLFYSIVLPDIVDRIITFLAFATACFIIGLSIYYYSIANRKFEETLEEKNKSLVEKIEQLNQANKEIKENEKYIVEYKLAGKIQSQLMPKETPMIDGYSVDSLFWPSRFVSGDYYDFAMYHNDYLFVFVFDVSGKGLQASYVTMGIHTAIRLEVSNSREPKTIMQKLNERLYNMRTEHSRCAAFIGRLNLKTNEFTYTNAGIAMSYFIQGSTVKSMEVGGFMLGGIENCQYNQETVSFSKGDRFVVTSDGVEDLVNENHVKYGREAAESLFENFQNFQTVKQKLSQYRGESSLADDLTIVTIQKE